MIFLGIDPGIGGAVAFIQPTQPVQVYDTPSFIIRGGKTAKGNEKKRREYDLAEMRRILDGCVYCAAVDNDGIRACIENVHSMPDQGIAGAFSFGRGLGIWEGLLVGMKIPYERVSPQRWKKLLLQDMQKGKGASIAVAKQLYPGVDLHRKKDHNRADALLLAEYGRKTYCLT